jgi:branched-chain amino acid transport system substrate-binding protein
MEYTTPWGDKMTMRGSDHQLQMPLRIEVHSDKNVEFDFDNSGFGLVTETTVPVERTTQSTSCKMKRPS